MKIIGAGLPRTATTTQMYALEKLDCGPCYHMRDLLLDLERGLPLWEAVAEGKPDWETIFGEARSTCDWPSARYYRELMDYYPEAKVLLSVRDGEEWAKSMQRDDLGDVVRALRHPLPLTGADGRRPAVGPLHQIDVRHELGRRDGGVPG